MKIYLADCITQAYREADPDEKAKREYRLIRAGIRRRLLNYFERRAQLHMVDLYLRRKEF